MTPARRFLAVALALLALTLGTYAGVMANGFVNLDDPLYVTQNQHVLEGLTWNGLVYACTTFDTGNWIPLTWLSLESTTTFFGGAAAGFHAVNVLWHSVNVVLLSLLLLRMTGRFWPSALTAALFAVHPLHVESVAWISERKDVLCGFWLLVTCLVYEQFVRRPGAGTYALLIVSYALGLMSKSMLVTLPVLLLCLDVWPLERLKLERSNVGGSAIAALRRLIWEKLPLLALAVADGLITIVAQRSAASVMGAERLGLAGRIGQAALAYVWYLQKTCWPVGLCAFYAHPLSRLNWAAVGPAALALLLISLGVAIGARHGRRWLLFGWLWFLISLAPVIGLLQVGAQAYADRYVYLPHIGLLVLIAWEADFWLNRVKWKAPTAIAIAATILIGCSALTLRQVATWRSSETLWRQVLRVEPQNWLANYQLGVILCEQGDLPGARPLLEQAITARPTWNEALRSLAWVEGQLQHSPAAEELYQRAVDAHPRDVDSLAQLSALQAARGDLARAEQTLARWVQLSPRDAAGRVRLGLLSARQNRMAEALEQFQVALQLDPRSAAAHTNAGLALAALQRPQEARREFEQAVQLDPANVDAHINLARLLEQLGDATAARSHYQSALLLRPEDPEAQAGLARFKALRPELK